MLELNKEKIITEITRNPVFTNRVFKSVWLAGSYAKDTATKESDIDFIIEYNTKAFNSKNLSAWSFDIIVLEKMFEKKIQFIPNDRFPEMDLEKEAIKIK